MLAVAVATCGLGGTKTDLLRGIFGVQGTGAGAHLDVGRAEALSATELAQIHVFPPHVTAGIAAYSSHSSRLHSLSVHPDPLLPAVLHSDITGDQDPVNGDRDDVTAHEAVDAADDDDVKVDEDDAKTHEAVDVADEDDVKADQDGVKAHGGVVTVDDDTTEADEGDTNADENVTQADRNGVKARNDNATVEEGDTPSIRKLPLKRLVTAMVQTFNTDLRMTDTVHRVLQAVAEAYLEQTFKCAHALAQHRTNDRGTIQSYDLYLARRLQDDLRYHQSESIHQARVIRTTRQLPRSQNHLVQQVKHVNKKKTKKRKRKREHKLKDIIYARATTAEYSTPRSPSKRARNAPTVDFSLGDGETNHVGGVKVLNPALGSEVVMFPDAPPIASFKFANET